MNNRPIDGRSSETYSHPIDIIITTINSSVILNTFFYMLVLRRLLELNIVELDYDSVINSG